MIGTKKHQSFMIGVFLAIISASLFILFVFNPFSMSTNQEITNVLPLQMESIEKNESDYINNFVQSKFYVRMGSRTCEKNLTLQRFDNNGFTSDKIFFLETSGRSHFNPRQACAIESAARNSDMKIVVMLRNDHLNLANNIACQLYKNFANIHFFQIVPEDDFKQTPLQGFTEMKQFKESKFPSTHLSDALRIAYVYKYGGWYADVDYLFLKSLSNYQNIFGGVCGDGNPNHWWVTNSVFNFQTSKHPIAKAYLETTKLEYKGKKRAEIGPSFLTQIIRKHCNIPKSSRLSVIQGNNNCDGMSIIHPDHFSKVRPGMDGKILWRKSNDTVTCDYWDSLFEDSLAVHFFSSASHKNPVTDPTRHAYAYLAPKHCPLSWYGSSEFHGSYII